MQDPRIRLGCTLLLSFAAFISIPGALLTVIWWIFCTKRTTSFQNARIVALVFMIPVVASLATSLSGGDGLSYLVRIASVLLIASWAYSERYPGEILDVSVWLFGRRTGFDIGLIGEMSLSSTEVLADEFRRMRIALRQKGQHLSPKLLPPLLTSLMIRQFRLARERACILALRGYRGGGSLCPVFVTPYPDIASGALCVLIFAVSLIT
jgi:energy-coupling factor transport system permease protein